MSVKGTIKIQQFSVDAKKGIIQESVLSPLSSGKVQEAVFSLPTSSLITHLPAITSPFARTPTKGFVTSNEETWSDSPTRQPYLLYRHRFAWGRDNRELFPIDGRAALSLASAGQKWGALKNLSGEVVYERVYPVSTTGSIRQFRVKGVSSIQEKVYNTTSTFNRISELGKVDGDVTVETFPFLLTAVPEPFSIKNPTDTDVYVRLANYANPIASGTITLHLDDVLQSTLQITEFFGGLGGFDVTWPNSALFDYDAQVDVKWVFFDTDIPANRFVIRYPFYTVPDLAGPRISSLVPADSSSSVPISGTIQFEVEDYETDVDIDSLLLFVNNIKIIDGEHGVISKARYENKKGYTVRYTPNKPWLYGDLIPVAIFVNDLSKSRNQTFFTYSFSTVDSIAPRIINMSPAPCTQDVTVGSDIRLDVIDGGHGIDKKTLVFTVEETEETTDVMVIPIVHRD